MKLLWMSAEKVAGGAKDERGERSTGGHSGGNSRPNERTKTTTLPPTDKTRLQCMKKKKGKREDFRSFHRSIGPTDRSRFEPRVGRSVARSVLRRSVSWSTLETNKNCCR